MNSGVGCKCMYSNFTLYMICSSCGAGVEGDGAGRGGSWAGLWRLDKVCHDEWLVKVCHVYVTRQCDVHIVQFICSSKKKKLIINRLM